jgi:homoserine O-acetyltransferase
MKLPALLVVAAVGATAAEYPPPKEADFVIRDFRFSTGETLPQLRLHYRTIGTSDGNNAVLILHGTGGSGKPFLAEQFAGRLFGAGQLLDASKHFIILPDAIGHGGSSKPSDKLGEKFPHYGYEDIVTAQYRLVTEGLGLKHLRLVMGTSMGGMQTWIWGERYPDFMSALMPLASAPVEIGGRNRFFRRMMIDSLRSDPVNGLRPALYILMIMTGCPLEIQKEAPNREKADELFDTTYRKRADGVNGIDLLYQVDSSRDYNPQPRLEEMQAPLLAINSADDQVNPPELGIVEREIRRVKHGRFVLLPISDQTRGHGTHSLPAVWGSYLAELLQDSQ